MASADLTLQIGSEVLGEDRIAFAVEVRLGDGRHIVERVVCELEAGRIVQQFDVEAWDPS